LKYTDNFGIAPGSQASQYTFRGNSCYDPDYTSAGHQPRYYDQYATIYSKYLVLGSSIKISMMNNAGTSPVFMVIIPATEILTLTTGAPASEYPRARTSKLLGVSGYQTTSISNSAQTETILGLIPGQIKDMDYSSLTGANPLELWYWNCFFQNVNATNLTISVQIEMVFDVQFYDRIGIGPS